MSVSGIIFANLHDQYIPQLTTTRTLASVPFGCRYRLIDFPLSNFANSGISDVHVITQTNYHSLMDHLGSGKDWDLARRVGGLKLYPPFITAYSSNEAQMYSTRLNALKNLSMLINRSSDDYIVLADCDGICNIDINALVEDHIKNGADITFAIKRVFLTPEKAKHNSIVTSSPDGELLDMIREPKNISGEVDINIHIWVATRTYLQRVIAEAIARDYESFIKDIIARNIGRDNYRVYRYDGYYAKITSIVDYFDCNMTLLNDKNVRDALFHVPNRPIVTKVRNSTPTEYLPGSSAVNSMIADGCVIEGHVENSIIFRGVKIGKGAVVKNSILFQDTQIGRSASVNCVITDKSVYIRDGVSIAGHPSIPFCIEKEKVL
ncbi:MAG: glucose-1-phosphate adenylyltransferase subunit GlgD [Ruminococcaceae bacterium]|nr:glucose-1-phosphate adenylyltransferase subunit GlgD [Oscillospiraceae bacterium]